MTLRTRLTAVAAGVVLAVLALAGFAVVRAQERLLLESLDESLQQQADRALAGPLAPVVQAPGDDDALAQLVEGDQVVTEDGGADRARPLAPGPAPGQRAVRTVADVVAGEPPYRVLSVGLDGELVLHLAVPLDDVRDSRAALLGALLVIGPLTAALLAGATWWLVGRALRPVEAMSAEVGTIGGGDLHRRLPVPATDDEIGRLGRTLNAMLDRLERADEQQRRFVADASHELRTPLTRMRAELEVDLAHPTGADPLATHRSVLEEVDGLQQLVDDLLHLARHDAGRPGADAVPVRLDEVTRAAVAITPRPPGIEVVVDEEGAGSSVAVVIGHPSALRRAVGNLLDNAVRHAQRRVWVVTRTAGGRAEVVVSDDGPGVPVEHRERVFERFTRLDEARQADDGGAGLGLAIVHGVVAAHGGSVHLDERPGGGARITVSLPRVEEGPDG